MDIFAENVNLMLKNRYLLSFPLTAS